MNPEILFRGKREDNGEWVAGYYFPKYDITIPGLSKTFILKQNEVGDVLWIEVDPTTICRYTGLTDKNGVKIFEGDVIRACLNPGVEIGSVERDGRIASFIVKFPNDKCVTFLDVFQAKARVQDKVWIEVIGNIHDDPELLEEAQP